MGELSVGADLQVYRAVPNDPPVEDDWGSFVLVTPAELLAEIEGLKEELGNERRRAINAETALIYERKFGASSHESSPTHGRHCPCSACAREDWTRPDLVPCGMHGRDCPPVYAPWASSQESRPDE